MFKSLCHFDRIRRTGFHTEIAHGAEFEVVDQFIDRFFLFSLGGQFVFKDHFDGTIGAGQFTGLAAGTTVLIVFVVWHHHFSLETIRKFQCIAVVRILLGDNFFVVGEVVHRTLHPRRQRFDRPKDI